MSEPSQRDEILAGILVGLETQADFDVEAELARHPELAPELRRNLSELGAAGMLPASPDRAGFVRDVAQLGIDEPPAWRPVPEITASRTAAELVVPRLIGDRYRLHSIVGRGGMGAVYAAEDLELQREVALKLLLFRAETEPQARRRLARLLREARVTGHLDHPGIVPVYGVGLTSDRRLYYTMKLVRGRSLRELVRAYEKREPGIERELTIERRIEIVLRMCEALAFAHERGVVHRDLTPNNVMVGRFGEVLVMDWGIAKLLDQPDPANDGSVDGDARESSPHRTTPGSFVGTPNFAAPEQARGELHTIDERTDVFGVGAILHYLLTGQPPYVGRDRDEVEERARQARRCEPEPSSTFARPPRELVAVSLKAMAADPRQRYVTIEALAADLRAFVAHERGTAWRDGPFATVVKSVRRHPTRAAVVVGGALCLLLAVLAYQQYALRRTADDLHQSEQARREQAEHDRMTRNLVSTLARLSDQYATRAHDRMGPEAFANIDRTLSVFRDCGFALDDASPAESVAMKIGSLRKYDSELWKVLSDGIFDLAQRFELSKLGHAHRLKHGTLPARTSAARREEARRVLEGQPELTALFPRVRAILDALPLDPWDAEYRKYFEARYDRFEYPPDLDTLERTWPGPPETMGRLAGLLATIDGPDRARASKQLFQRVAELDPSNSVAHMQLGLRYESAGPDQDFDRSLGHYMAFVALQPKSSVGLNNLAGALMRKGWNDEAVDAAERAIEIEPGYVAAWVNLGVARYRSGALPAALEVLTRSISMEPTNASAHANRALVWWKLGRPDEGLADCFETLRLDPNHKQARLLVLKHPERAAAQGCDSEFVAVARRVVDGDTAPSFTRSRLARALAALGRDDEALAAIDLTSDDPDERGAVARIFARSGPREMSLDELHRCLNAHLEDLTVSKSRPPDDHVDELRDLLDNEDYARFWQPSIDDPLRRPIRELRESFESVLELARAERDQSGWPN